jgi:hypothetical protein
MVAEIGFKPFTEAQTKVLQNIHPLLPFWHRWFVPKT